MAWTFVGERTFTPDDLTEAIGNFSLEEGQDTLWVRVTQIGEPATEPWAYGILSWRSGDGNELGSCKAYGKNHSEVFRLGVGRSPSLRDGVITFTPRGFNLAWIKNGWPWALKFEAVSGSSGGTAAPSETQATIMVPAVPRGNALPDFQIEGELARLLLNLFFKR
tara:strand:+ start:634 stop:1128 length:495 start_codon:yes stop_codon:yes gene_type:complete